MNANENIPKYGIRGRGRGNIKVMPLQMGPPTRPAPKRRQRGTPAFTTSSSSHIHWQSASSINSSTLKTGRSTPSTSDPEPRIVVALSEGRGEARYEVGIAAINVAHPALILCQISDSQSYMNTLTKINILNPREILIPLTFMETHASSRLMEKVKEQFRDIKITGVSRASFNKIHGLQYVKDLCLPSLNSVVLVLQHRYYALAAASALLLYAEKVLFIFYAKESIKIEYQESEGSTLIDIGTADSLELVACARPTAKKKYSCLFDVLNHCCTKVGMRKLRASILQPPCSIPEIEARLDCVTEFIENPEMLLATQTILLKLGNVDQLLTFATFVPEQGSSERQLNYLLVLNSLLEHMSPLRDIFQNTQQPFFVELRTTLGDQIFSEIKDIIGTMIHTDAYPSKGQNGDIQRCFAIKAGLNSLLDLVRKSYSERLDDMRDYVKYLADKYTLALTLNNNNKKGYHIAMTLNAHQKKTFKKSDLPHEMIQVERLANTCSMKTQELINLSSRVEDIMFEILKMSNIMIFKVLLQIREHISIFYKLCEDIAKLDMLQSLAQASTNMHNVRPSFSDYTDIVDARHPLLDYLCTDEPVSNSIFASTEYNMNIITGPNGSGKSIFIRQVVLIQVIAQLGCYVPAQSAILRASDQILARIHLGDNMDCGASSFVLEMKEIQYFLTVMTSNSLIIIDELCRSTSMEEGTTLAMAICERLLKSPAFIFFTTHYKPITKLWDIYFNVRTWQMETVAEKRNNSISLQFTYNIVPGVTELENYGIALAKASLPARVVQFSEKTLLHLQKSYRKRPNTQQIIQASRLKYDLETELKYLKKKNKLIPDILNDKLRLYQLELQNLGYTIELPAIYLQNSQCNMFGNNTGFAPPTFDLFNQSHSPLQFQDQSGINEMPVEEFSRNLSFMLNPECSDRNEMCQNLSGMPSPQYENRPCEYFVQEEVPRNMNNFDLEAMSYPKTVFNTIPGTFPDYDTSYRSSQYNTSQYLNILEPEVLLHSISGELDAPNSFIISSQQSIISQEISFSTSGNKQSVYSYSHLKVNSTNHNVFPDNDQQSQCDDSESILSISEPQFSLPLQQNIERTSTPIIMNSLPVNNVWNQNKPITITNSARSTLSQTGLMTSKSTNSDTIKWGEKQISSNTKNSKTSSDSITWTITKNNRYNNDPDVIDALNAVQECSNYFLDSDEWDFTDATNSVQITLENSTSQQSQVLEKTTEKYDIKFDSQKKECDMFDLPKGIIIHSDINLPSSSMQKNEGKNALALNITEKMKTLEIEKNGNLIPTSYSKYQKFTYNEAKLASVRNIKKISNLEQNVDYPVQFSQVTRKINACSSQLKQKQDECPTHAKPVSQNLINDFDKHSTIALNRQTTNSITHQRSFDNEYMAHQKNVASKCLQFEESIQTRPVPTNESDLTKDILNLEINQMHNKTCGLTQDSKIHSSLDNVRRHKDNTQTYQRNNAARLKQKTILEYFQQPQQLPKVNKYRLVNQPDKGYQSAVLSPYNTLTLNKSLGDSYLLSKTVAIIPQDIQQNQISNISEELTYNAQEQLVLNSNNVVDKHSSTVSVQKLNDSATLPQGNKQIQECSFKNNKIIQDILNNDNIIHNASPNSLIYNEIAEQRNISRVEETEKNIVKRHCDFAYFSEDIGTMLDKIEKSLSTNHVENDSSLQKVETHINNKTSNESASNFGESQTMLQDSTSLNNKNCTLKTDNVNISLLSQHSINYETALEDTVDKVEIEQKSEPVQNTDYIANSILETAKTFNTESNTLPSQRSATENLTLHSVQTTSQISQNVSNIITDDKINNICNKTDHQNVPNEDLDNIHLKPTETKVDLIINSIPDDVLETSPKSNNDSKNNSNITSKFINSNNCQTSIENTNYNMDSVSADNFETNEITCNSNKDLPVSMELCFSQTTQPNEIISQKVPPTARTNLHCSLEPLGDIVKELFSDESMEESQHETQDLTQRNQFTLPNIKSQSYNKKSSIKIQKRLGCRMTFNQKTSFNNESQVKEHSESNSSLESKNGMEIHSQPHLMDSSGDLFLTPNVSTTIKNTDSSSELFLSLVDNTPTKHSVINGPKPKRPKLSKFVPPRKLTKKEIEMAYVEQDKKLLESDNPSQYLKNIINRPSVKQLQQAKYLASARKTDDGIVVLSAKQHRQVRKRKFVTPLKNTKFASSSFDITLFSDKNSDKFEEFMIGTKPKSLPVRTVVSSFQFVQSQEMKKSYGSQCTPLNKYSQQTEEFKSDFMQNTNNSQDKTNSKEGYYTQHKTQIDNLVNKYLNSDKYVERNSQPKVSHFEDFSSSIFDQSLLEDD